MLSELKQTYLLYYVTLLQKYFLFITTSTSVQNKYVDTSDIAVC